MIKTIAAALGTLLAAAAFATSASAQTLSPNFDPSASFSIGVNFWDFDNFYSTDGFYIHDVLNPGPTYPRGDAPWGTSPRRFKIRYANGSLRVYLTQDDGSDLQLVEYPVSGGANWNYIAISLLNTGTGEFGIRGISLSRPTNGDWSIPSSISLGDTLIPAPVEGYNRGEWQITGATLGPDFELAGSMVFSGGFSDGISTAVYIYMGYRQPTDGLGPVSSITQPISALLNGTVTVTANVNDAATGNNNIASAQYSLDDGPWQPMTDQNGLPGPFSAPSATVHATFVPTMVGTHKVCVHGTDVIGNLGPAACQDYTVSYRLDGFFQPVDNPPVLNSANAGKAVPVKWRLTDANGVPIDNPASFVSLTSYPVSCTDFSGDPTSALEEVAAGGSGLQYAGDGYWQFNWNTPKTYAGTCRVMGVQFNDGAGSPVARFKFK